VPLLVGGLAVAVLGMQTLFGLWDLVERLSGQRDAYIIPKVLEYASREAEIERRRVFATRIRGHLPRRSSLARRRS